MRIRLLLGAGFICAAIPLFVLACACSKNVPAPVPEVPPARPKAVQPLPSPVQKPAKPVLPPPMTREEFVLPPAHFWGREATMGEFTVCAVTRYWAGPTPEVVTLDAAIAAGDCVFRESGRRDYLTAEVSGTSPVFALVGDLLFGGMQDRLLARSVVLENGTCSVPVFTAETWQWPAGERPETKLMRRYKDCPQVDLNVRAAVYQAGDQASVTSSILQVARKLQVPDAEGRGAYRRVFDTPRAAEIEAMVARARTIVWAFTVGFVVYHGKKLIAADMFDSSWLLESLTEDLLTSYAMTAVYGDVSNWAIAPAPETIPEPKLPQPPPYRTPFDYEPPKGLPVINDADLIRHECRRNADSRPVHTGWFRR